MTRIIQLATGRHDLYLVRLLDMVLSSSTLSPTITPAIIQPLGHQVKLGLTIAFTTLYGLLFLLILSQLLLILYYQHRRLSYQTVFLFSCLIWAALRTTLFSFYFKNCDCFISNQLPAVVYWLFFAFPVYLQYNMLSILVFYFYLVRKCKQIISSLNLILNIFRLQ